MPKQSCIIDQSNCTASLVKTRSKKKLKLFFCKNCDFEFFLHNPKKNLAKNKLDVSRLKKAGLNIPNLREDFQNGLESKSRRHFCHLGRLKGSRGPTQVV